MKRKFKSIPVPLTVEQKVRRIENAIRRLGYDEKPLNGLIRMIQLRLLELPQLRAWEVEIEKEYSKSSLWDFLSSKVAYSQREIKVKRKRRRKK